MRKVDPVYIVVPLFVLGVAYLGQYFTMQGMDWYGALTLPSFTPSGTFIWVVWTIIFVLFALSAIWFFKKKEYDKKFGLVISLYADNMILNALWSRLFFVKHRFTASIADMILLLLITVVLMIAVWPRSKWSAYFLVPYVLRLMMATYFAIQIRILN